MSLTQRPEVADLGTFWVRLLARAARPGGIDAWARIKPDKHDNGVITLLVRGESAHVVPPISMADGIRRLQDPDLAGALGADEQTHEQLTAALATRQAERMSPRAAAQVVQVALYGEVKFP
jgi:hypothetical protein